MLTATIPLIAAASNATSDPALKLAWPGRTISNTPTKRVRPRSSACTYDFAEEEHGADGHEQRVE